MQVSMGWHSKFSSDSSIIIPTGGKMAQTPKQVVTWIKKVWVVGAFNVLNYTKNVNQAIFNKSNIVTYLIVYRMILIYLWYDEE